MKITLNLKKIKKETILIGTVILALIILRIPSLFEPHWYSDEGFFASIANAIKSGNLLYKDIWTSNPPGIFLIYYLAALSNNLTLFSVKLLNLLFSTFSLVLIYKIAKELFSHKIAIIASIISAILLSLPILDANIANPENFFLLFTLLGIYLSIRNTLPTSFFAGISFGISMLFGKSPVFEIAAILVYQIFTLKLQHKKSQGIKSLGLMLIGLVIPLLVMFSCFISNGILNDYFDSVFRYNFTEILQASDDSLGFIVFANTIFVRTIILIIIITFRYYLFLKGQINQPRFLLDLWATFVIYAVLFTQKPYNHYLIQAVPIFSIFISLLIIELQEKNTFRKKIQQVTSFLLTIFLILSLFTSGQKLVGNINCISYYLNFSKYLGGKTDTSSYVKFFGKETYQTYRLNNYLAQNYPEEKNIYVWTDNSWIYSLADLKPSIKYLQSFQAKNNFGQIKSTLVASPPTLVIIDQNSQNPQELISYLEENNYQLEKKFEEYQIYLHNED